METILPQAQARTGPFSKLLHFFGGIDRETLRECPPHDHDVAASIGALQGAVLIYMTALFSIIGHLLFAEPEQIRPELIAAGFFLAAFIALIDRLFITSSWHMSGLDGVKRGGLDISGGPTVRVKANIFLAIRIILSVGLAQLTAVFLSLLVFQKDIERRIDNGYLQANAAVIGDASKPVNDGVQRATDAVNAQQGRVASLAGQINAIRQNEIDPSSGDPQVRQAQQEVEQLIARQVKADDDVRAAETFASNERGGIKGNGNSGLAGDGPRHRAAMQQLANARNHAREITSALSAARERLDGLRKQSVASAGQSRQRLHDQLPNYESALAEESAKLDRLKGELAELTRDRESAIRRAVETAPGYVRRDDGFLARIRMLERIAEEDTKIAIVIILFEITAFGFEISAILGKAANYIPTTYAAHLARNAYMAEVRTVDEILAELNRPKTQEEPPDREPPLSYFKAANDNLPQYQPPREAEPFAVFEEPPPQPPPMPPKRPRGRPRKTTLN